MPPYRTIYQELATGYCYIRTYSTATQVRPDHTNLNGKPSVLLELARFVFDRDTHEHITIEYPSGAFRNMAQPFNRSVGVTELAVFFKECKQWGAVQNTPLDKLLQEYDENKWGRDPLKMAKMAIRYAESMEDSQMRCLLASMAYLLIENEKKIIDTEPGIIPVNNVASSQ